MPGFSYAAPANESRPLRHPASASPDPLCIRGPLRLSRDAQARCRHDRQVFGVFGFGLDFVPARGSCRCRFNRICRYALEVLLRAPACTMRAAGCVGVQVKRRQDAVAAGFRWQERLTRSRALDPLCIRGPLRMSRDAQARCLHDRQCFGGFSVGLGFVPARGACRWRRNEPAGRAGSAPARPRMHDKGRRMRGGTGEAEAGCRSGRLSLAGAAYEKPGACPPTHPAARPANNPRAGPFLRGTRRSRRWGR